MRRNPAWIISALALVLFIGAGGCASEQQAKPPVCDSFASAQVTVSHIRDVNVSENGLSQLAPYLTQLRDQLAVLYNDAKTQFAAEADQLKAAADQLGVSLRTAQAEPSVLNLAAVRTAVTVLRTSWQNLRTAMAQTC